MAKQDFTAGQVLTAAQMDSLQANDYNWTVSTKTDSYVLVAADAGTRVVMNAATAKTITVNSGVFAAGDIVWIHNINTGTCTVTAGTCTVNTEASLALGQWGGGTLYFTSGSSAIFFRGGTSYGVATGGSSSSITVGGVNYTMLTFTASGTLTVSKAGLFDVLVVGGGSGGNSYSTGANGGGAGGVAIQTVYYSANQTVTIGAGGTAGAFTSPHTGNPSAIGTKPDLIGAPGGVCAINQSGAAQGSIGGISGSIAGQANGGVDNIYGFKGGDSSATNNGGGGGGNTAVGGNGTTNVGGNGGAGYDASAWRGESAGTTYYAGGGGGGGATTNGTGGVGGGGTAAAGGANTGGGGGGNAGTANNGGSGIVLVRFKV